MNRSDTWGFLMPGGGMTYVSPTVHGNIGHAMESLRGAHEMQFRRVVLELDHAWQPHLKLIQDGIAALGPVPGAIFFPRDKIVLPVPDPSDPSISHPREVMTGAWLPCTLDSITSLLWLARHEPGWHPDIWLVDDATDFSRQSETELALTKIAGFDAAEVEQLGATAFYEKWRAYIGGKEPRIPENRIREACMARFLRQAQTLSDPTLAVFGAAHVARLLENLQQPGGGSRDVSLPTAPLGSLSLRVVAIPPAAVFGCMGWMGDLPYLTARAWTNVLAGDFRFDREEAFAQMLAEAYEQTGRSVSIRQIETILETIRKQRAAAGMMRVSIENLMDVAAAFVDAAFADFLASEIALSYPGNHQTSITEVEVLPGRESNTFFLFNDTRDEVYLYARPSGRCSDKDCRIAIRLKYARFRKKSLTRKEEHHSGTGWMIKAPHEEEGTHWLSQLTRQLGHPALNTGEERRSPPQRVEGAPNMIRLDVRRTIRARMDGDRHGYYERPPLRRKRVTPVCEECALVYIWGDVTLDTEHTTGFFVDPQNSRVRILSSLYWFAERTAINRFVKESRIALLVKLLPDVIPFNDRQAVASMLSRVSADQRCLKPFWEDPVLTSRFRTIFDLAVAGAIRWTRTDHIIVVDCTHEGPAISEGVHDFARERRVRIARLSRSCYPPLVLDRYALDTELQAKGPYEGPLFPSLTRFVRPLYGFFG